MIPTEWKCEDFIEAGARFRDRWHAASLHFERKLQGLFDITLFVNREFKLSDVQLTSLEQYPNGQHRMIAKMDLRFRQCPETTDLDSPYTVLLEIIEHGGSISIEHGIIDIRDQSSKSVASFMLRHA